ncbi:MAG: hypothetical protein OEY14_05420, partial [Myxococcales bacterium]|nr:hypothetical protein [Myxococcales bacterium]
MRTDPDQARAEIAEAFRRVTTTLDDPLWEPAAGDRRGSLEALHEIAATFRTAVLEPLWRRDEGGIEATEATHLDAALVCSELSALHALADDATAAERWIAAALRLEPGEPYREEFMAARHDPLGHAALVHARWLLRAGESSRADAILRGLGRSTRERALLAAVKTLLDRPRALSSAPALFTLNGIGVGLYGSRDARPDDSYVATHCICFLFVPIFPLSAYRVRHEGGRSYSFLSQVPLSGFAKGARGALLGALLLAMLGWGVRRHLDDPARQAAIALEGAQSLEATRSHEEALAAYQALLETYEWSASDEISRDAARGILRLESQAIAEPISIDSLEPLLQLARRYHALPERARGLLADEMMARIEGWISQLEPDPELAAQDPARIAALRACVRLAALLPEPSPSGQDHSGALREDLRLRLASALSAAWPLDALRELESLESAEGAALREDLLASLADAPSLLIEARASIERYAESRDGGGADSTLADTLLTRLEAQALLAGPREAALASEQAEALLAFAQAHPLDQDASAALAERALAAGEGDQALERLEALGPPGRMNSAALRSYASALAQTGREAEAASLLRTLSANRLNAFQAAYAAYEARANQLEAELESRIRDNTLPPSLVARLAPLDDDQQAAGLQEWFVEELRADAELSGLREAYQKEAPVVGIALQLGMLELRRAGAARGAEKEALLLEAERALLAIQAQAQGMPSFHLGLGQVYHRLGRAEEAERELRGVLESGDEALQMQTAAIYRELGLLDRAREVAEALFSSGSSEEIRRGAATFRARLAPNLEEEEEWLLMAPGASPALEIDRMDARGRRLLRDGDSSGADALFASIADHYAQNAAQHSVAANNLAIALHYRYLASGDREHLARSVRELTRAYRLRPDDALVIGNLADATLYLGLLDLLERRVPLSSLRPSSSQLQRLALSL